jgi:hypothetical protein
MKVAKKDRILNNKIDSFSLGPEILHFFMEPEDSLLCSLEPAIGPYPEPIRSSPQSFFIKLYFNRGRLFECLQQIIQPIW